MGSRLYGYNSGAPVSGARWSYISYLKLNI